MGFVGFSEQVCEFGSNFSQGGREKCVREKNKIENAKCSAFHCHKTSPKINTRRKVPKKGRLSLPEGGINLGI